MSYYKRVNYYELCRLCTSSEGFKIHIFCEDGKRRKLQHKIQICLPLRINENDSLPKIVCAGCLEKLESFYDFRETCISSENMLESYFTSMKTSDNLKDGKVYIKEQTDSSKRNAKNVIKIGNVTSSSNTESQKPVVIDKTNLVKVTGVEMVVPPLAQQQQQQLRQPQIHQNVVVANQMQPSSNAPQFMISLTPTSNDILQLQIKDSSLPDRYKLIDQLPALLAQNKCKSIFINNEDLVNSQLANNSSFIVPSSSGINKVTNSKNKKLNDDKVNNHITYTNPMSTTLILNDSQNHSNGTTNVVSTIVTPTSSHAKVEQRHEMSTPNYGTFDSQTNLTNSLIDNHFNQSLANMNHNNLLSTATTNLFQTATTTMTTTTTAAVAAAAAASSTTSTNDAEFVLPHDYDMSDLKLEVGEENPSNTCSNNNNNDNNNSSVAHSGLFMCETCEKTFKRKEHLIQHRKLHSGERPFLCTQCGKAFSRKEHLLRHSVSHTGAKSFQCDECQKTFSRKDNLHKHKKTHLSGGPYVCNICNRNFVIKHYYQVHKQAHGEEAGIQADSRNQSTNVIRTNRKTKSREPIKNDSKPEIKLVQNIPVTDSSSFRQSNQMQTTLQNVIPISGNSSQLAQILTSQKFREKYQLKMERSDLMSSGIIVFNKQEQNDNNTNSTVADYMISNEKKSSMEGKIKKIKSSTSHNPSIPNNNVLFSSGFINKNTSINSQFLDQSQMTFNLDQKQN